MVTFSDETSRGCPSEISYGEASASKTFILTTDQLIENIVCKVLPDGKSYIDSINSEVILVAPSPVSKASVSKGRYWMCTTRVVDSLPEARLQTKSERFVKLAELIFRLVRARSIRREAYPGYKYYFAPKADTLIRDHPGIWCVQSAYVFENHLA